VRLKGLILALGALAWPCAADTISYSDSEFATANWALTELADTSIDGQGSASQSTTGGNPGAFYNGHHSYQGAGLIRYGHVYSPSGGASVDPSLGAITSIDFAFDLKVISGTSGPATNQSALSDPAIVFYYLIEQGGNYFLSSSVYSLLNQSDGWQSFSSSGLAASNFLRLNPVSGLFEAGQSPDFSTSGDVMHFGFAQANSNPSNTPNYNVVNMDWGVDNWSVTVNTEAATGGTDPVPEPGTLALFGIVVLGYGAYRRRRTRA
jgi:hypothetical protein